MALTHLHAFKNLSRLRICATTRVCAALPQTNQHRLYSKILQFLYVGGTGGGGLRQSSHELACCNHLDSAFSVANFYSDMAIRHEVIAKQWEDIKPTFLRLYHDENKSLDQVRRELEEKYHFKASKSAFTRHIEKWNAFKNYKALDKEQLALQRIHGQQPQVDLQGRPIKWDRVYRATRGQRIQKRCQSSRGCASRSVECMRILSFATQPLSQPVDHDSRALSFVVDIWRHSTLQFASKDPSTPSYHGEYSLYNQLMQSMSIITLSSNLQWPKLEIDNVCNTIPALVRVRPAMVCELLTFLRTRESPESFVGYKALRDQLFDYIRNMSREVLPEFSPFRRFISYLHNREAFTRLGAAIAKVKLDTMWNTPVVQAGKTQHDRPFFNQVLIHAIHVVMDYGELEFASKALKKLSDYDVKGPFYLAACARLLDKQGKHEEAMDKRNEALILDDPLHPSGPGSDIGTINYARIDQVTKP